MKRRSKICTRVASKVPYPLEELDHKELISRSTENKGSPIYRSNAKDCLAQTLHPLRSIHPISTASHSHSHHCTNHYRNPLSPNPQTQSLPWKNSFNLTIKIPCPKQLPITKTKILWSINCLVNTILHQFTCKIVPARFQKAQ